MNSHQNIIDAKQILSELGMPAAQQNDRSALCLLALLNLAPEKSWSDIQARLIGITSMMKFVAQHYGYNYAPNTRETFRRETIHQFVSAGIAQYNPDNLGRPVNSPKAAYQIETNTLELLKKFGLYDWKEQLEIYLSERQTLAQRYANEREMRRVPVIIREDMQITLSPGEHSNLIKSVVEDFASRFIPGSFLIYAGDTGDKWGYFNETLLRELGVKVDLHGKMPDVVLYYSDKNWLILVEAVTSHGPMNAKRRTELSHLFASSSANCVFVTAFLNRITLARYLTDIAWETEVWVADNPTHLIHFDGIRFLGPYSLK